MKLEEARQIAEALKADLKPFCERIEIGGPIRRQKPEPNDIELVCIPKFTDSGTGQLTLFDSEITIAENLLFNHLAAKYFVLKIGKKYAQSQLGEDVIKVDIFTATECTWGYIFLLRTGPREFSKWAVTELKRRGYVPKDGTIWSGGEPMLTRDETDVFHLLQISDIYPEYRFKEVMWK